MIHDKKRVQNKKMSQYQCEEFDSNCGESHFSNINANLRMGDKQISESKAKIKKSPHCFGDVLGKLTNKWKQKQKNKKNIVEIPSQTIKNKEGKNSSRDNTMSTHNNSVHDSSHEDRNIPTFLTYRQIKFMTTGDKINYHLDALELFVVLIEEVCLEKEEILWEQLKFLLMKKYYSERKKIQKFLKKYPICTPFKLEKAQIETQQMLNYMKLTTGKFRLNSISEQNKQIYKKLNQLHSKKDYSNLNKNDQPEYLVKILFKKLWEYIVCLDVDYSLNPQSNGLKMSIALQLGFLISELQGRKLIDLQDREKALMGSEIESYISVNKRIYAQNLCR